MALLQTLVFPQAIRIHFARVLKGNSEENWAKLLCSFLSMTPPALPPSRCPLSRKANLFLFLRGNLVRKRIWVQGITEMELFKKCSAN